MSPSHLRTVFIACVVLLCTPAMAAKGPSPAEIKKHSSQTLKTGSKGAAAQCKAACKASKSCESYKYDDRSKRCEMMEARSIEKQTATPARSR